MEGTEVFRALGSADRQILLYKLVTADEPVSEADLARTVAARRHQIPRETVREPKIRRAHIRLVHVHLPMLADMDVVTRDDDTVALTDDACREQLLEAADAIDAWPPDDLLALPPA